MLGHPVRIFEIKDLAVQYFFDKANVNEATRMIRTLGSNRKAPCTQDYRFPQGSVGSLEKPTFQNLECVSLSAKDKRSTPSSC